MIQKARNFMACPRTLNVSATAPPVGGHDAAGHARTLLDAMVRLEEDTEIAPELARRLESVLELLENHIQPVEVIAVSGQEYRRGRRGAATRTARRYPGS